MKILTLIGGIILTAFLMICLGWIITGVVYIIKHWKDIFL